MDSSFLAEGFDVRQLSDEQLLEQLLDHGFEAGPIIDSTRIVYQKKLASLLRNEDMLQSSDDANHSEEDDIDRAGDALDRPEPTIPRISTKSQKNMPEGSLFYIFLKWLLVIGAVILAIAISKNMQN